MPDLERRFLAQPVEVRKGQEQSRTVGGYASVFNKWSDDIGGFIERVDPAAFNKSKGDGWPGVMARYNHNADFLLGTTAAGTLRVSIDSIGLPYDVDVPESRADVYELIQRGDVAQSSFAFQTYEDDWEYNNGITQRSLLSVRLIDVAPTPTPAYPDATVGLRSLAKKVDASYDEVRTLAQQHELRRLFIRTDGPASITRLRADLLAKKTPSI